MGWNRTHTRRSQRDAYALLTRRWRDRRRSQAELDALGVPPAERIGSRPPFSAFAAACRRSPGTSPMELAQGNLREMLEFLAAERKDGGLEIAWRGMTPPLPPRLEVHPDAVAHTVSEDGAHSVPEVPLVEVAP